MDVTLSPSSLIPSPPPSRIWPSRQLPAELGSDVLVKRLRELAGDERAVQVDFLLHLDEFDRRRAFLDLGYDSLWSYCLHVLHLREGTAGRRIAAMRVLRRFPSLEAPLRDGRLCLSTVIVLGPILTSENLDDLVARAAFKTKADVEKLAASLQPRVAPKDGIRKIARGEARVASQDASLLVLPIERAEAAASAPLLASSGGVIPEGPKHEAPPAPALVPGRGPRDATSGCATAAAAAAATPAANAVATAAPMATVAPTLTSPLVPPLPAATRHEPRRQELRPVSADEWSLRVTMSEQMKEDLDTLKYLLSHKAGGDLSEVLHEAIRCAIEKHGRRKGAVIPARARAPRSSNQPAVVPGPRVAETPAGAELGRAPATPTAEVIGVATSAAVEHEPTASTDAKHVTPASSMSSGPGVSDTASTPERASRAVSLVARSSAPAVTRTSRSKPRAIDVAVRREVWLRDEACCAWVGEDGKRCRSRWKLEFDHIRPVALGGTSTVDNLRLACRAHNLRHAERVYGREHMARFAGREPAAAVDSWLRARRPIA